MTDEEAHEIYEQTKLQKSIACGSFRDCYEILHPKLKHSLAVLVMTVGYKPENIESFLQQEKRIIAASEYVIKNDVLTPQIHYSGIIEDKPVTIKEFVVGQPLYQRNGGEHERRVVDNFCRQNRIPMPGEFEDISYIVGLIESYNEQSAFDMAETEQDIYNKFYRDCLVVQKAKTVLDMNPDNYIKTPKGLYIIDPVSCKFDGEEEKIDERSIDSLHSTLSNILLPPARFTLSVNEDLEHDKAQIKEKSKIAMEELKAQML